MLELDALRRRPRNGPAKPALQPDGHVAQPDGPMPGVEKRLRDDADRVGEVHDPRTGRRPPVGLLG
jgi:hypothetical protein